MTASDPNLLRLQNWYAAMCNGDWVICKLTDGAFQAYGGTKNLNEILTIFWIGRNSTASRDRRKFTT